MKTITTILALALVGAALTGCGPKEDADPKVPTTNDSAGTMDQKNGGTQTPTDK